MRPIPSYLTVPPRCLDDVDDEVRDRAAMYLRMFKESLLAATYVKEGESPGVSVLVTRLTGFQNLSSHWMFSNRSSSHMSTICRLLRFHSTLLPSQKSVGLKPLLRLLVGPSRNITFFNSHSHTGPSSLETVGVQAKKEATPTPQLSAVETQSAYIQQLKEVPELATYGEVLGSSKPVQLTESETEYQASCVKHIFAEHIVFQVRSCPSVIGWR